VGAVGAVDICRCRRVRAGAGRRRGARTPICRSDQFAIYSWPFTAADIATDIATVNDTRGIDIYPLNALPEYGRDR
jgi:hypothetical protein